MESSSTCEQTNRALLQKLSSQLYYQRNSEKIKADQRVRNASMTQQEMEYCAARRLASYYRCRLKRAGGLISNAPNES